MRVIPIGIETPVPVLPGEDVTAMAMPPERAALFGLSFPPLVGDGFRVRSLTTKLGAIVETDTLAATFARDRLLGSHPFGALKLEANEVLSMTLRNVSSEPLTFVCVFLFLVLGDDGWAPKARKVGG